MNLLFHAHSGLRYLVLLAALVALGHALRSFARAAPNQGRALLPQRVFAGLVDLQVLLGLILLLQTPFYPALTGHIVMMVLAAIAVHVPPAVNRRRAPEQRSWALNAAGAALALLFIVGGILAIGRPVI